MKKILMLLCLFVFAKVGFSQNLTDTVGFQGLVVPQYMSSGTSNRLPVIFRAKVINLTPNTTYRYYTNLAAFSDLGTANSGAGNPLLMATSSWKYTSSVSTTVSTGYDEFTTNNSGEFEGWFGVVNTGNARFTAGRYVRPSIVIADQSGTLLKKWAMSDSIKVLALATSNGANDGSGLYGYSLSSAQDIIAVYEQSTDTRPSSITFTENVTISGTAFSSLAKFYTDSVRNKNGAWGTIIRNDNTNGIQKIERWSFARGVLIATNTDNDGAWPTSADTRSATAGVNGLLINATDAPLVAPTIAVNTSGFTNDFGLTYPNNPSSASNFVFEGSYLTDSLEIIINPPFEIRTGSNAFASGSIKVGHSSGTIVTTVLDVRFNPTSTGVFEDSIVFSSPGADDKKVYVKGTASNNPELSFKVTSFNVSEAVGSINLQINISNANSTATTCSLSVVGGSATAGSDFTFTSPQVINFPANSSDSIIVNIPIIDDNISEGTETIWFALSNATNGAVFGANDSALVTITDNDYRKVNIADLRGVNANGVSDSLNKLYEITGVVYGHNLRTAGFQFTLRDQTAGIGIFGPADAFGYTVAQGDSLTIRGRLSQFNGLAQLDFLDTIIFHQSNQPLRTPFLITSLNENGESELVRMNNVTAKTGNWISGNQYVYYNGGADSVMVRLVPNTHKLIGKPKPTKTFSIIGIGGQFDASSPYNTGYQLFPRDSNDIIIPADSLSAFNLLTPANNSTVTIQGASTQTLDATWEPPVPAQGLNPATYTFMLDVPTGDFTAPLASFPSNVGGSAPALSLPYFQIVALMNAQGLQVGQSISLKWTVKATTSTYSKLANQPFAITLVRERMNSVGNTAANPLAVYPNPANTDVLVEMPETINTVYVSTIEGKQVIALNNVNTFSTGVDVSMLETGIYMLTVETASGIYTQRLAIQR